jgi:hypothetical protein
MGDREEEVAGRVLLPGETDVVLRLFIPQASKPLSAAEIDRRLQGWYDATTSLQCR